VLPTLLAATSSERRPRAGGGGVVSEMVDTECPHGIDTRWCTVCKHGPTKAGPVTIERTFRARYAGECMGCRFPISEGEVIHLLSNGAYIHQGCE
jgi:hypothetical protein